MNFSISALYYLLSIPGPSGNLARFLPTLILVDLIIAASSAGKSGALRVTDGDSAWCLSFGP
jgi:hypothetical protein